LEDSILLSILEKEFHRKIQDENRRFFGRKKKLRDLTKKRLGLLIFGTPSLYICKKEISIT